MKSSITFASEFAKKYKVPVVSHEPPPIPILPDVPVETKAIYSGKRRGRKPGSKKVIDDVEKIFRKEVVDVDVLFP
jgi:hypothetical protein